MGTIRSHVREGGYRDSLLRAVGLHLALPLLVLVTSLLVPVHVIELLGGGQGSGGGAQMVTAVLTETVGGEGAVYPMLKPNPTPAPPPVRKPDPAPEPVSPDEPVFVEEKTRPPDTDNPPVNANVRRPERTQQRDQEPGQIPTKPKPGKPGPVGGVPGTGQGGAAGGGGVEIGPGGGTGEVDSFYVRLVRQRVSRNWLRTSMGKVEGHVESIVLFDVDGNGRIRNVNFEKRSGVAAVDRAAERAVLASNPLPQPPPRFRGRLLRFRALFVFPPN